MQELDFFGLNATWNKEYAIIHGGVDLHVCYDPPVDQDNRGASFILYCELLEFVRSMGIEAEIGSHLPIISRKWKEGFDVALTRYRHIAHEDFHRRVPELDLAGKGWSITGSALAMETDCQCWRFFAARKEEAWEQSRHED